MTNFLYGMQDELMELNVSVSIQNWSTISKLINHVENQGKQLRDLNNRCKKLTDTILDKEKEIESYKNANKNLYQKVCELNDGIRSSEDLTWKQKYDLAVKEKECAVNALQNKCKFLENQMAKIEENFKKLERKRNELIDKNNKLERANLDQGDTIGMYVEEFKKLKDENEKLKSANALYVDDLKTLRKEVEFYKNKEFNIKNKALHDLLREYIMRCEELEIKLEIAESKVV